MRRVSVLLAALMLLAACGGAPVVTAQQVVAQLKAAGLEVENPQPMTKDDYGPAPFLCEGQRFLIPSLGTNKGGRLFVCPNTGDVDKLKTYYQKLGEASAVFFSWTFNKGNVLVQINGELPEPQARKYEAAINSLP